MSLQFEESTVQLGRPKDSGKRWTDAHVAELWAEMRFAMHRGCHSEVRRAARDLVLRGFFQFADGKIWQSRNLTATELREKQALAREMHALRRGDERNYNPEEALRAAYYVAERRRKVDTEFCDWCDWYLQSLIDGVFRYTATFRRTRNKT